MNKLQSLSLLLIGIFFCVQSGFSQNTLPLSATKIIPVNAGQKTLMQASKTLRIELNQSSNNTPGANVSGVVCASEADITIPTSICEDEAVSFTLGAACVTDTGFDDPATPGGVSGFGFVVYVDPITGIIGAIPAGAVGTDVFADPNYIFFATNGADTGGSGGCDDLSFPPGFFVGIVAGCDPVALEIGVFGLDVINFNLGTATNPEGCDIIPFPMVVNPVLGAPSLEVDGCVATITGACPNDVLTLSNGNGSESGPGNVVTYTLDPEGDGQVGDQVDLDVANGGCSVGFFYNPDDVQGPSAVTCPATASCMTAETISADLVEEYGYLFVDVTGDDSFLDEISIDISVNGGPLQNVMPLGTFPNGPTTGSIAVGPVLLGVAGSGPYTVDITVNDSFGDGLSFPADGTITIYDGQDATGAVLLTASGNYGASTGVTGAAISVDFIIAGVWSGMGVTDNGDGTASFEMGMNGNYTLTYTFTDMIGCVTTATCDVLVEDCSTEEVPTVGEWGLIILGLMMSITAIVGIRQRIGEDVIA